MRLPRAVLVVLLLPLGCLHEYHPEYHPQSAYTYVENTSYPTTVFEVQAPVVASDARAPARGEHRALAPTRAPSSLASAPRPAGPPVSIRGGESTAPPGRADHEAASVAVTWPEADPSFRDLFAAERERIRARSQARSADAWEQVVGKPRPGGGMTDVVVDVPVKDAREIAERTPLINVPCMLPGFHAARYGTVVEIRNHPETDGFAQVLLKVDARWDAAWADARGKEVATSFELGPRHLLVVGHIAGPAAEGADEALRRSGACRSDANGELRCGQSRLALLAQAFE
jgi:hypothetical protein